MKIYGEEKRWKKKKCRFFEKDEEKCRFMDV